MSAAGLFGFGSITGVGRLGWLSAAVAVATAAFVVSRAAPVYDAARAHSVTAEGQESITTTVASFTESVKRDAGQVDGRSLFFIPPPPPPKPPPNPPPPPLGDPPKPPPTPPPPRTYGGPKIIGAAIDSVWFDNGKRLTAGGEADGDLRVIEIQQVPWSAKLEWKGIVFDVPFIARDSVVIKDPASPASSPEPEPQPPASAPATQTPASTSPAPAAPSTEPDKDAAKPDPEKKEESKEEKKEEKKDGAPAPPPAPAPAPPPDKPDK
ncbi:MAG: hypothetical protein AB7O77_04525 [Phycisphaerales bacterium]